MKPNFAPQPPTPPAPGAASIPAEPGAAAQRSGAGPQPMIALMQTERFLVDWTGCYAFDPRSDANDPRWIRITDTPVLPVMRVRGRNADGETKVAYIFRIYSKGASEDAMISGSALLGPNLGAALGDLGLVLTLGEQTAMRDLMIDLLKRRKDKLPETRSPEHLGWNEGRAEFVLGNKSYMANGAIVSVPAWGNLRPYCDCTEPAGSLAKWREIAAVYNHDDMLWAQAVVASAFASPLMSLEHLEKAALLFVKGGRGVGKTTALKLACSVYGNPNLLMFSGKDSPETRNLKLGLLSDVAAAFDEMTGLSPQQAAEFTSALTQGRGCVPDRLADGRPAVAETSWSCLPVACANDSIVNALSGLESDKAAQMSRVLEIQAGDFNDKRPSEQVKKDEAILRGIPENYGHAGSIYIRRLLASLEEVKAEIRLVQNRFEQDCALNSNHRFWPYMCARLCVGMSLAKRLGLLPYDEKKFYDYLVERVKEAKAAVEENDEQKLPRSKLLQDFIEENRGHILVVNTAAPKADGMGPGSGRPILDEGYVALRPSNPNRLIGRMELDSGNLALDENALFKWLKAKGTVANRSQYDKPFIGAIKAEKIYDVVAKSGRRDLGAGTALSLGSPVKCLVVKRIDREEDLRPGA